MYVVSSDKPALLDTHVHYTSDVQRYIVVFLPPLSELFHPLLRLWVFQLPLFITLPISRNTHHERPQDLLPFSQAQC